MTLDRFVPGSICHAPHEGPLPACKVRSSRLALRMICAIVRGKYRLYLCNAGLTLCDGQCDLLAFNAVEARIMRW